MVTDGELQAAIDAACEMIKKFEGFSGRAYCATDVEKSRGLYTIGYGFTTDKRGGVILKDDTITRASADRQLREHVEGLSETVVSGLQVQLAANQIAAVVSLVYNIGIGAFKESTLLKKLNAGDFEAAAKEFLRWDKQAGKPLPGLTKRRKKEMRLFIGEAV